MIAILMSPSITACSLVRIQQVAQYSDTQNPTCMLTCPNSHPTLSAVIPGSVRGTDLLSQIPDDYVGLSAWSLAEMHASVIIICMPSMAKFFQRCYLQVSYLTASSGIHRGHSTQRFATLPQPHENAPTKKRGPLSRILYALDHMTNNVRSRLSTSGQHQSSSSQKSLTSGTDHKVEHTTFDQSVPEYADYAKYYAQYGTESTGPETTELQHMV